jgi:hypothetical protein
MVRLTTRYLSTARCSRPSGAGILSVTYPLSRHAWGSLGKQRAVQGGRRASRGLAPRMARMKRWHAQRSPRVHLVWRAAGAAWDRDLCGLENGDRVLVLRRTAAHGEAWMPQVQPQGADGSTSA